MTARKITPHKGGRVRWLSAARLTENELEFFEQRRAIFGMSVSDFVMWMVGETAHIEPEKHASHTNLISGHSRSGKTNIEAPQEEPDNDEK